MYHRRQNNRTTDDITCFGLPLDFGDLRVEKGEIMLEEMPNGVSNRRLLRLQNDQQYA